MSDQPCIRLNELKVAERQPIGQGGFAKVYRAWHPTHHMVAVKILTSNLDMRQFESERRILNSAHAANACVPYYGYISENWRGLHYNGLMFKFMECGSLYELLYRHNVYPENCLAFRMLYDISEGMQKLHEINRDNRVLHCDLKPGNILLDSDLHAKLCDFGGSMFATVTECRHRVIKTDPTGTKTVHYCAPEFFQDDFRRTSKYDVYSFAIVAWGLLARSLPYVGRNDDQVKLFVTGGGRPDINSIMDNECIKELIQRCWDHSSSERPDFREIFGTLEPLAATEERVMANAVQQAKEALMRKLNITSFQRPSEHFRHPFTWIFDANILPENPQPIPEDPVPDGDRLLSDQDCHTLGRQFNGSWSILLGDLGIPLRHMDNIKEDYRRNEEKKIAVFRLWKQINPGLTVRSVYRKLRELRVDMDCFAFLDPSGIILGEILNPSP